MVDTQEQQASVVAWAVVDTQEDCWVLNSILALVTSFMLPSAQPLAQALPATWQPPTAQPQAQAQGSGPGRRPYARCSGQGTLPLLLCQFFCHLD